MAPYGENQKKILLEMTKCNGTKILPQNLISLTFWTIFFTENIGYLLKKFPVIGTWGTKYLNNLPILTCKKYYVNIHCQILCYSLDIREKGRDLTQSYDKSPYTNRNNTTMPPKTLITQRLRTDLGRSVGVTTATLLVWLNRFTGSVLCRSLNHNQIDLKISVSCTI